MKTVILKVNNATQTIAEHTIVTKDGKPTVIKAAQNVNYELFDQSIGRAPNHIVTKRVGNDLHVSMEDEGEASDLIIEGFYNDPNSALIGVAENGEYYYYIPDTGEVADFVTQLQVGDVEGQALGGDSQVAPWWIGATEGSFNALPWLVGLAGVGIVGAALSGGSSSSKGPVRDTTAPDAPTATVSSDGTTVTGKTEPGATVEIKDINGQVIGTAIADNKGDYTVKLDTPLINGETITAEATDKTGNTSEPTSAKAPDNSDNTAPSKPTLTPSTDDGSIKVDLPTDAKAGDTVTVEGTNEAGEPVEATLTKQPDGTWKSDNEAFVPSTDATNPNSTTIPEAAIKDGTSVSAEAKDPSGNTNGPVTTTAGNDADNTAPAAPTTAPDMTAATDTGTSDTDNLTSDTTPDFTVATPTDGTPVLIIDGVEVPTTVVDNGDGTSTLTPTAPLTEGEHTVAVATKDPAGNVSDPSAALPVTIDPVAPAAPTTAPDMTAATDTGTSDTDNLTSDTTPDFTVATPTDGTPVLIIDGVEVPTTVVDNGDGTSTLTPTAPLTEGEHTVAVATKDPAGNVSDPSAALPVTIDPVAPAAPTTAPDMTAATDTGTSDTDNLTSDTTPDFTVATPTDGTPVLIIDGVEVPTTVVDNGDGTSTLTPTAPLTEGEHTVAVATKDPAGNVSDPSAALPVTIDPVAPAAPTTAPDMTAATDTGTSDTDNLTSDTTPDFTVATPTDGTPVLIIDGVEVPTTVVDNGDGTSTLTPTAPLTEGEHTVAVATKDPAGNVSDPSAALPVTIDPVAPAAPTTAPDMTAATDTGTSDTDNLTSDTTPDFTVATPTDGTPVLIIDGVEVPTTVVDNGDGTSTLTPTAPLTEGEHTVAVATKDPAGNVSDPSAALPVTIDPVAPAAPTTAPDMTAATDTGTSDTDNLTSDTTPDFTVATPTDGTPVLIIDGVEVPTTVVDNGDGTSTLTPTAPLTEGEHTVAVATKDPAGNVSDPSAALPVTIDPVAPAAPTTAPDMTAATDTGTSDTDNLTSDTTPDFTVATPTDGTPVLIIDGVEVPTTVVDNGDGTSTLTPTAPLTEGEHTVAVATKDPAGNVSDPSAALPVTIDPVAPAAPTTAPDMTAATDTGTSDTDNLTSDTTPDFTVATPTDGTPVLIIDGVEVPTTVVDNGDGTSTLTPTAPLTEGEHTVAVATKDPAGNVSDPSAALPVIVDATVPGDTDNDGVADQAPVVTIPEAADGVNAEELSNGVETNVTIPTGTQEGDTVTLTITNPDGTTSTVEHTVDQAEIDAGTAAVTIPKDQIPADGDYSVVAEITDSAGNSSGPSETVAFTVDATVPGDTDNDGVADQAPVVTIPEAADGVNAEELSNGVETNVTIPTGTQEGDTVTLTITNPDGTTSTVEHTVDQAEIDAGTAAVTIPKDQIPADGDYSVVAEITDSAGNSSGPSETVAFTVDATVPGDTDNDGVADQAPVVTIPEAADGVNAEELSNGVETNVTIPTGTQEGDTVTLTITNPDGTTSTVEHTVDQAEIDAGTAAVTIPKDQIPADGDYSVVAEITDSAGNSSGPSETVAFTVDATVPGDTDNDGVADQAPVLTIPEAADGVNAEELSNGVETNVTIPTGTQEGDTVTLTITNPDGTTSTVEHTVDQAEIDAGTAAVTIPKDQIPADGDYSVVAEITDSAGNSSGPSETVAFTVDATVPGDTDNDGVADQAPVVTIPEAADGVNAEELSNGVETNVTIPTGTQEGDTVTLTITNPDGTTSTVEHTVDQAEIDAGTAAVTIPKDQIPADGDYSVVAEITDSAGNSSGPSETVAFTVDATVPGDTDNDGVADQAPVVTIPEAADGVNAEELSNGVETNVTIPTGTQEGDTVTLTITNPDGTTSTVEHTVDQAEIDAGTAAVTIPKDQIPADGDYSVVAEITDSAGNSSGPSETVAFTVDATVPGDTDNDGVADQAPVVTIPEAADGVNAEELSNGVETNVTIPTGTQEGDTVTLTITNPDGTTSTVEHTVDQAEIDAGTAAVTIPKDQIPADGDYSVVAEITDSAGNSSGPSETVAFTVDATVPDAPTVNPIETNDATPVITGTATVGEGETLTVTLGGATYTVTPDADGNWSVNTETATPISGTFTSLPVGTYDVKATVTDLAGNVTNDSSTNELTITPPSAVISSVTNADLLESGASQTAFTINLTPNTNSPTTAQFSIGAGTASSSDYSNFTFSNGVTFNSATGLLNIPKGVSSFTISTIPTEDRTTEGQETIVANIGGTSYTSTISDTSVSQASITVTGPDVTNFNGAQLPAVQEKDSTAAGVLTYTVTLDKAPEVDTIVKITLSGIATPGGQLGADYVVNGITNYTGYANNVVTVTIPKGQTQAVFHVDPLLEQSSQTFTAEPNESVIATINSSSNIAVSTTQGSATGVIIDSNPTAMRNITGDMSLLVGPVVGGLDNPLLNGASETVENGGLVTTNYDDQVFMGYYQNGVDSGGAGNISALLVAGGAGRITDGNSNITTIDLADGNDTLKIRDTQDALTRVYLGEGDDKYIVGNNLYSGYSFGESGNDIFNVTNTIGNGHQLYAGSGSDTITAGTINGLVDLGSGNTMPDAYLKTYNNSSLSLGNDSNVDLVTDVNTVTVRTGNISGTILGGEGIDNITVKLGNIDGGTLSLGSNNDSINILEGYIQGGSSIDMGDGNDTLVALGINNSSSINMGAGNDTVTLTATNNNGFGSGFGSATLDMGAGDDTVIFAGSSMDGTINGGVGNDTFNFTGSNQNLNGIKQFETINLGNKSNELNISFEDVLNANNKAVFINGGSTDTVDLGGNGTIPGGAGDQAGIRYIDNNALFNANDTFWVKGTSTQVGYDMYVYQGSSNAPNNEGYTVYIDTNIGTVI